MTSGLCTYVCLLERQQIIYDWEKSGNGFGQRAINDSSWGHYTSEHKKHMDGDNRASFLCKDYQNKEHLLYLWHIADSEDILSNMLNVLSKDVSVDCDGNIFVNTAGTQNKRKKTAAEEQELNERTKFRRKLGQSLDRLSISAMVEKIDQIESRAIDFELKALTEQDTPTQMKLTGYARSMWAKAKDLSSDLALARKEYRAEEEQDEEGDSCE